MEKQISRNHHYIPRCYLKWFTNDHDILYLLYKGKNKVEKNARNTKSVFYEKDRNLFFIKGELSDIVEEVYSQYDNDLANVLQLINDGASEKEVFSGAGYNAIKKLICMQLFRLPVFDQITESIMSNIDFSNTRNCIAVNGERIGSNNDFYKRIRTDKNYRYYFRCFILPILVFDVIGDNENRNWYFFETSSEWQKHIISNNPIIVRDYNKILDFSTEIVMPITKQKLLIHTMKPVLNREEITPSFVTHADVLQIIQSTNYVCGPDKEYMENLIPIYHELKNIPISQMYSNFFDKIK